MMVKQGIFKDLKVLELASVLAGPSVGQFFAELGAQVVKVENLATGGDVTRSWRLANEGVDDRSAYFCSCNWGKKSIGIDLMKTEGQETVQRLARWCDVVIASYKPGDAFKLGVDYASIRKINSKVVYGQVTGYGGDNDRVGYDAVIQAEAGFMDLNGEAGGDPVKMPVALIDVLAGHQLKEGMLIAMLNKEKTGEGSFVEVSLIQSAVASLVNQASNWLVANRLPQRQGSAHPNIAPYGESFLTKDGKRLLLAIGSDRQFADLCKVLGCPQLIIEERFADNTSRVENRKALNEHLCESMAGVQSKELLELLNARKIPVGIIQNMKEVFEMEEAKELIMHVNGFTGVKSFVGGLGVVSGDILPPPHFGEHTGEVMEIVRGLSTKGC